MTRPRVKLLVAAIVVVVAMSILAYAGVQRGRTYYMDVDAYLADSSVHDKRTRVCGTVAAEGLDIRAGERSLRFVLRGNTKSLPVAFHGTIPEMFKSDIDVVAEGKLDAAGVFQADTVLTKCASKYKPAAPSSQPGGRS